MGRLDLPDTVRDEDIWFEDPLYSLGGDDSNPGTRQVLSPLAKGGVSSDRVRVDRPVAPVLTPPPSFA
jgi:hypothetical protein